MVKSIFVSMETEVIVFDSLKTGYMLLFFFQISHNFSFSPFGTPESYVAASKGVHYFPFFGGCLTPGGVSLETWLVGRLARRHGFFQGGRQFKVFDAFIVIS